jgi:transcriptional regulator with XRE-family HTH domain
VGIQTEAIIAALGEARRRKGWSQRDLSQRAGVPQSHISRIESGVVDLKLTTLLELARLLDLDLMLIPREALTAVNATLRETRGGAAARSVRILLGRLSRVAAELKAAWPDESSVLRLEQLVQDLYSLEPVFQTPGRLAELERISREIVSAARHGLTGIRRAVRTLADFRSNLVHTRPDSERPAYSLDDED